MVNKVYKLYQGQLVPHTYQAFLSYAIGGVFHIKFFQEIGDLAGSLSGIAVGILTCLNLGVSPVLLLSLV